MRRLIFINNAKQHKACREKGAAFVEYVLLTLMIAIAAIASLQSAGRSIGESFRIAAHDLDGGTSEGGRGTGAVGGASGGNGSGTSGGAVTTSRR